MQWRNKFGALLCIYVHIYAQKSTLLRALLRAEYVSRALSSIYRAL